MDTFELKKRFAFTLKDDSDFQILCRVIDDQSTIDEEGNRSLKKGQEISSASLQIPVEEEATYRFKSGKHHKGYVANVVETVDENLSFITQYVFEQNIHSDVAFAYETIERLGKKEQETVLVADGACDSEDSKKLGKSDRINLVNTELKGHSPNPIYEGIMINEEENTVTLPNVFTAQSVSYYEDTDTYRAVFDKEDFTLNPSEITESMKEQKKTYTLTITLKTVQRAKQVKKMKTKYFMKLTFFRNGVEGIPSVLRRAYNVDRIPFRGLMRKTLFWT